MRTIQQFLVVVVVYPLLSVPGFGQTGTVNICGRTDGVEEAILAAISDPPPACDDAVLASDLAGITSLNLLIAGIDSLANGDFAGLSGLETLDLRANAFTTLPADVFDGLSALETLLLGTNNFTTLPADVFEGLSALEDLDLEAASLTALPAGVFEGLSALESLDLRSNPFTTLPAGVFDGLSALENLNLSGNDFTALTGLPAGVFDDVLDTLGAIDVAFFVDDTVRNAHFVCSRTDAATIVAATAGVTDCLRITSAQLAVALSPNAVLSALTISQGMLTPDFDRTTLTYSATVPNTVATLTITPTTVDSGATVAVTVNAGAAMTTPFTAALDVGTNEIEIVVTAADSSTLTYRLTVTRDPTVNICDRTPQVEAAILAAINTTPACESVPAADLAGITALDLFGDFRDDDTTSLASGDFAGLSALEELNLGFNAFTTLPADIFDGLAALETLLLGVNSLTTLPAGVFDDLSALERLALNNNGLTTLPAGVFDRLSALEQLILSGNDFTTLPAGVFDRLSALELLALNNNDLTTLPAGVFDGLSALEQLTLHGNDFTTLPDGVFDRLSMLEILNLRDNNFTTLPDGVFDRLSMLEILNLGNNDNGLTTLSDGVFDDLAVLEELFLNGNDLSTLPDGIFDGLSMLETLNLGDNGLTTLPDGVLDDLAALESLSLNGNAFTTLPAGVFDDVLDTLGAIGESESFRVDDTVRDAHFVCSRAADADAIVAATAGVDDCLRITTAQLVAALSNAGLSTLTISQVTLTPVFDPATFTYSAMVPNTVTTLTLTPTAAGSGATVAVTVNAGAAIPNPPFTAALNVGANDIAIVVTAANSITPTYRLTVTRANNPLDLNQDQTVNAQDAQILYYLSLTPRPDNLLNTLLGNAENIAALEAGAAALAGADRFDLVGNDGLNQNDWRLLYYALRFEDELSASPALQDALGVTEATLDAVRGLIE